LLSRQRERCDEAFALATEIMGRNPLADGVAHAARAQALVWQGDSARAEVEARQACAMLEMMPTLRLHPLAVLMRLLMTDARGHEALLLAEQGQAELTRGDGGYNEVAFRLALAEVRDERGDRDGARAALTDTLAAIDKRARGVADLLLRASYKTQVAENVRADELLRSWSSSASS
jgi:ATP/maltotriose-dependent transcriptional regulator MalT